MAGSARLTGLGLACVLTWLLIALAIGTQISSASEGHAFVRSVSATALGSSLQAPVAVAVDETRALTFVGDPAGGYVDVFSASGNFVTRFGDGLLGATGIGVDEESGDVYVADGTADAIKVYRPDDSGAYAFVSEWWGLAVPGGEFGHVTGVAVDNSASVSSGDVYVLDGASLAGATGAVDVFRPKPAGADGALEGNLVRSITAGKMELPGGIAVSRGTGRVLVADSAKGTVYAFDASGSPEEKLTGKGSPFGSLKASAETGPGNAAAVAVDDTSGELYVAETERHAVSEYSSTGVWEGWITTTPAGDLGEPRGVALSAGGEIWIADAAVHQADLFAPDAVVARVETEKVAKSALTRTSALLPGSVNGEGQSATYRFQYGETEALGKQTASQTAGAGESTVSATAEGLSAGHGYFYRLVAEDEGGVSYGAIRSFETMPAVEGLETGAALGVQSEAATLTGSLKRGGLTTHFYFQYGATTAYGEQAPDPAEELPAADQKTEKQPRLVQAALTGLAPNTTYHYRLVAVNSFGTTFAEDRTFTTVGPPVLTVGPATKLGQHEATVNVKINPGQLETSYHVEYGETEGYGEETAPETLPAGGSAVARSIALTGLRLGATYHYRIVAGNQAGTTDSADHTLSTIASASVDATFATEVGPSQATVHAQINPLGNDTHFYFEYGTEPCASAPAHCLEIPAAPGTDIGEGTEDVAGEAQLIELQPGTVYHFRAVALNALGETFGPERSFTTEAATATFTLPDGRAWEMVTPPDKAGAPVEALTREGGVILASENGTGLAYVANGAFGEGVEGNRSPEMQQYLATRTVSGWRSQDLANPNTKAKGLTAGETPEYHLFSSDLSQAVAEPIGAGAEPPLAPGVTENTPYLRNNNTATYLPLVTEADVAAGVKFSDKVHVDSGTPDLTHVVLRSRVGLTGGRSQPGLYEWANRHLSFVSVLPGGAPAHGAEPELGFSHDAANAVSTDGSRVIWTLPSGPAEAGRGYLYLRDTSSNETVRLDGAQGVSEPSEASAQFQTASSDGSRVFFTDARRLTPDSTAEFRQGSVQPDLYECDIVRREDGKLACQLTDLTVDHNAAAHADVQGVVFGASQDGTAAYLVAQGVLASNANGNGESAEAGAFNLYRIHLEGGEWTRTFIARLAGSDEAEWEAARVANLSFLTARVSPDGRYMAFMSAAPLTGYDNIDASPAAKGARDQEVYLYDAESAALRCISCDPSGARPNGVLDTQQAGEGLGLLVDRRGVWLGQRLAGNIPGWTAQSLPAPAQPGALLQSRYLSDDGRLYFNSPDGLVPAASNGKEDVYEYEPTGVGGCESGTGGCISLISSGSSDRESAFLEATPDGSDVFFLSEARLLPQDTDTAFDIYDARECNAGSPCLTPPAPPSPPCAETATCRPAASAQPSNVSGGSVTYSGPGNGAAPQVQVKGEQQSKPTTKHLTRRQLLARALRRCRHRYAHSKRAHQRCERQARKRYGTRKGASHKAGSSGAPTGTAKR